MANNFEFYAPTKVILGKGSENKTGKQIKKFEATSVLIAYGSERVKLSELLEKVENTLNNVQKYVLRIGRRCS